jgi:hypothetical protein
MHILENDKGCREIGGRVQNFTIQPLGIDQYQQGLDLL